MVQNISFHLQITPTEGQLISKCPFGVIVSTIVPTFYLRISILASKRRLNQKEKELYFFFDYSKII